MDAEDLRAFFAALSENDIEAVASRLADDVVLVFPGRRAA